MVSCLGDLLREYLLPSLVCRHAMHILMKGYFVFGDSIVSEFCMIFLCVDDYVVQVGKC